MRITFNGEPRQIREGLSLADLLERDHFIPARVATMVNGEVVARDRRQETPLASGDRVEVVTFAGGG